MRKFLLGVFAVLTMIVSHAYADEHSIIINPQDYLEYFETQEFCKQFQKNGDIQAYSDDLSHIANALVFNNMKEQQAAHDMAQYAMKLTMRLNKCNGYGGVVNTDNKADYLHYLPKGYSVK